MRTLLELTLFTGLLTAAMCFNAGTARAKPEYARRTQKECNFCHPADSWNLNDAGKYYRDHKYSLQGYKPPTDGKSDNKQHKGA